MTENNQGHWTDQKLRPYASMTAEQYVDERLNQFRGWYDKKASRAKSTYQWMRAITVVGGSAVPALVNLPLPDEVARYMTTVISLIVVVLISLETASAPATAVRRSFRRRRKDPAYYSVPGQK